MYQLTFAIITPALICGSFADRMKYGPMLVFMGLWHLLVYCPIAHAVWHPNGMNALYDNETSVNARIITLFLRYCLLQAFYSSLGSLTMLEEEWYTSHPVSGSLFRVISAFYVTKLLLCTDYSA